MSSLYQLWRFENFLENGKAKQVTAVRCESAISPAISRNNPSAISCESSCGIMIAVRSTRGLEAAYKAMLQVPGNGTRPCR